MNGKPFGLGSVHFFCDMHTLRSDIKRIRLYGMLPSECKVDKSAQVRLQGPVWGGADATPDRAIGPFADANLVSIPWRCGS